MERLILFSQPTEQNSEKLFAHLFPEEMKGVRFAYMPSNGRNSQHKYSDYWKTVAEARGFDFVFIDNTAEAEDALEEARKLDSANILLITGGNTFELLHNLRKSGLDQAIKNFRNKDQHVIAGFSAGAIVLSPRIDAASQPTGIDPTDLRDENLVGISDLTGLGIVEFEIFPHYYEESDRAVLDNYQQQTSHEVKALGDDELLILDK